MTTKSKPEQLNAIVTFLLDNRAGIASEDIERLASAFAPAQSEADEPEPKPDHSWIESGEHGAAEFPTVANKTLAIWKDFRTKDTFEVTRGRRKGVIEISFPQEPKKLTKDYLMSVKLKGSKERAFNYHGPTKVWYGEAEYFTRLTLHWKHVAGENTSELQAALDS